MALLHYDDFNRADGPVGSGWTMSTGSLKIQSSGCVASGASTNIMKSVTAGNNIVNVVVRAKVVSGTSGNASAIYARHTSSTSAYILVRDATGSLLLRKGTTTLAASVDTISNGDIMTLKVTQAAGVSSGYVEGFVGDTRKLVYADSGMISGAPASVKIVGGSTTEFDNISISDDSGLLPLATSHTVQFSDDFRVDGTLKSGWVGGNGPYASGGVMKNSSGTAHCVFYGDKIWQNGYISGRLMSSSGSIGFFMRSATSHESSPSPCYNVTFSIANQKVYVDRTHSAGIGSVATIDQPLGVFDLIYASVDGANVIKVMVNGVEIYNAPDMSPIAVTNGFWGVHVMPNSAVAEFSTGNFDGTPVDPNYVAPESGRRRSASVVKRSVVRGIV
jgi:hypothetical protein